MAYVFRFGDAKACCDRCGSDYRLSQLRKDWRGEMLCQYCWEPRNQQDFVRGVPDRQVVENARPEPEPVFILTDFILMEDRSPLLLEAPPIDPFPINAFGLEFQGLVF